VASLEGDNYYAVSVLLKSGLIREWPLMAGALQERGGGYSIVYTSKEHVYLKKPDNHI
jgi:hypothetical protein